MHDMEQNLARTGFLLNYFCLWKKTFESIQRERLQDIMASYLVNYNAIFQDILARSYTNHAQVFSTARHTQYDTHKN